MPLTIKPFISRQSVVQMVVASRREEVIDLIEYNDEDDDVTGNNIISLVDAGTETELDDSDTDETPAPASLSINNASTNQSQSSESES